MRNVRACMRACGDARAGWGAAACSERRSSKSSDSGGGLPKQHNVRMDRIVAANRIPLIR